MVMFVIRISEKMCAIHLKARKNLFKRRGEKRKLFFTSSLIHSLAQVSQSADQSECQARRAKQCNAAKKCK